MHTDFDEDAELVFVREPCGTQMGFGSDGAAAAAADAGEREPLH